MVDEIQPGDRVLTTIGRRSPCGRYYITESHEMQATLVEWDVISGVSWAMVLLDGAERPVRMAPGKIRPYTVLDKLAEIPE